MKKALLRALSGGALTLLGNTTFAQDATQQPVTVHIKSQPAADAINEWAKQTGYRVVWAGDSSAKIVVRAVDGMLTPQEALDRLLAGTDLRYQVVAEKTVTVRSTNSQHSQNSTGGTSQGNLPQAESGPRLASASSSSSSASADVGSGTDTQSFGEESGLRLAQVTVTGSHIRGEEPIGSQLIVVNREDIDKSGYGRIEDLLTTVPQNFKGVGEEFSQSRTENLNRGTEIQLRGLGPGTTLTLINGQRQPEGGLFGAFVDVSSIPLSAIEKIEILPDGASAIYGSDAIGGVANIILRKDFSGAETSLRHSISSGGVGDQTQVSQLLGTHWSSGHVMLAYQYSDTDAVPYGSRPYTSSSGDQRAFGGTDWRTVTGIIGASTGNPGNIVNSAGKVAYAIPYGQDGTHLTTSELIPGGINLRNISYASILPEQKMHSVFVDANQDIDDRLQVFANARFSTRNMLLLYPAAAQSVSVPSTNPFYVNPFAGTGPVSVRYDFSKDLGPETQMGTTDTIGATVGGTATLSPTWRLTVSGSYGKENDHWAWNGLINSPGLTAALADPNPATALNVFGDGSHTSAATLASISKATFERGVSTLRMMSAVADGTLFNLPAGSAKLAIGADRQNQDLSAVSNTDFQGQTYSSRADTAAFAELSVPLAGADFSAPGIRKLDLAVAGRYDRYSDFGSTFNPKFGLNWVVFNGLTLRATWGSSFRAPPFYLSNPSLSTTSSFTNVASDPTSPTGKTSVLEISGNNPGLRQETAKVWTTGVEWAPLRELSMSLTYFHIDYHDKIQAPSLNTVLKFESEWAGTGVIIRNPTPAQISAVCSRPDFTGDCSGSFGAIIDVSQRNIAVVEMRGMDLNANYALQTRLGTFDFAIGGSDTFSYDQAPTADAPAIDVLDTVGNPVKLRLRGGVSWHIADWSASASANYSSGYKDITFTPARNVDSWTTVDLGADYRVPARVRWLAGTKIFLGATNIFNKLPPFVNTLLGYDPANATLEGRMGSIQITKAW